MRFVYFLVCSLLLVCCLRVTAPAETLTYSSGTGFSVSREGYALTNNHVVKGCERVSVVGAVPLSSATVEARDETYDLALLKTDAAPPDIALFNNVRQPVKANDPVVVVGYPGQSWQTGERVIREAQVVDTHGPLGEEKWLLFSESLSPGNSGGPLLDASGNVVGVVAAKATITRYNTTAARNETVSRSDIAIALPVIRQFLSAHNVQYQTADSGIYLSADRVADKASQFVINVRCRLNE